MSDKTKELLAVLDMPPREQYFTVLEICDESPADRDCSSFADLAFRLRDEAVELDKGVLFGRGLAKICQKIYNNEGYNLHEFLSWAATLAKPIHWIIAALIAKELK